MSSTRTMHKNNKNISVKQQFAAVVGALFLCSPAVAFIPSLTAPKQTAPVAELSASVWADAAEMPYLGDVATVAATMVSAEPVASAAVGVDAPQWRRGVDRQLRRDTRNSNGLFVFLTEAEMSGAYFDGERVQIAQELDLRPEQFARVEALSPLVQRMAKRFELPPELLMAMIHTESTFKEDATSHANAYGLMQIVPKYAGRAATKLLTGKAVRPTPAQLIVAATNVELGSAYLTILQDRYFSNIENPNVRSMAVVAAYNWGPGRVTRTLRRFGTEPTEDEFLKLMIESAPRETSNYVQRVARRVGVYRDWFAHADKNDFEQPVYAHVYDLRDAVESIDTMADGAIELAPESIEEQVQTDIVLAMR